MTTKDLLDVLASSVEHYGEYCHPHIVGSRVLSDGKVEITTNDGTIQVWLCTVQEGVGQKSGV